MAERQAAAMLGSLLPPGWAFIKMLSSLLIEKSVNSLTQLWTLLATLPTSLQSNDQLFSVWVLGLSHREEMCLVL